MVVQEKGTGHNQDSPLNALALINPTHCLSSQNRNKNDPKFNRCIKEGMNLITETNPEPQTLGLNPDSIIFCATYASQALFASFSPSVKWHNQPTLNGHWENLKS